MGEIKMYLDPTDNKKYLCNVIEYGINYVAKIELISLKFILDCPFDNIKPIETTEDLLILLGWEKNKLKRCFEYNNLEIYFDLKMIGLFGKNNQNQSETPKFVGNLNDLLDFKKIDNVDFLKIEEYLNK